MAEENPLVQDTQFTCPKCGSHCFGTSCPIMKPGERIPSAAEAEAFWQANAEGQCHGACNFTWPRKDDHLYFTPTGRMRPRTVIGRSPR